MYKLIITKDIDEYYDEYSLVDGITVTFDTLEESLQILNTFIKKGFGIYIQPIKKEEDE